MPHTGDLKQYSTKPSDYKLLEEIGQGVSATVYRAICLPFNETVAIKSLDLEKCNSSLDDIRKEAQMMNLINHANVVRACCSFVKDHFLWVVMPYMAGGSCLHIMKLHYPDGFDEAVIATILKETLKALDYLHRHGHIHRDVKAGNILIDHTGNTKLGDFGVSACMFDTGDRQRARKTFCGTPCWMAPEVMEQLNGYDFKADIWSFGITALELAHGHAPFSKYPPLKILLMTLQNPPPGLDNERDKRFSKAMKEMIAMCLVKEPAKRPTAEKLLKHSFFKQAKGPEYIQKALLDGLPALGDRVKILKDKDEQRLAAQKLTSNVKEEISQNEYKRGVSSWNFDVEDLKRQAALIPDDDELELPPTVKEEDEKTSRTSSRRESEAVPADQPFLSASSSLVRDGDKDRTVGAPKVLAAEVEKFLFMPSSKGPDADRFPFQPPAPTASKPESGAETIGSIPQVERVPSPNPTGAGAVAALQAAERAAASRGRSGPLPGPTGQKAAAPVAKNVDTRSGPLPQPRKEPKHIGRFEVFEGDHEDVDGDSPDWHKDRLQDQRRGSGGSAEADYSGHGDRDRERERDKERERGRDSERSRGGAAVSERGIAAVRSLPRLGEEERDREREHRATQKSGPLDRMGSEYGRTSEDSGSHRGRERDRQNMSGPLNGPLANGTQPPTRPSSQAKESSDDKGKVVPLDKVQRKGRFSVTTEGESGVEDVPLPRKIMSSSHLSDKGSAPNSQPATPGSQAGSSVPMAVIIPHLQALMKHAAEQQDVVFHLMSSLTPSESGKLPRSGTAAELGDVPSERERELLLQVAELQGRLALMAEEQQALKQKNIQLEHQLNVFYNKEEEERIRREEAAREDG